MACRFSSHASAMTTTPRFRFVDKIEAGQFLQTKDAFTELLRPIDLSLRLGTNRDILVDDFLLFMRRQALNWDEVEIERANYYIQELTKALLKMKNEIKLPREILVIKTTGDGEFEAPHTRGNAIIFTERSGLSAFYHEFFHVLSRYNPNLRKEFYAIAGFQPFLQLALPQEIADFMITNPDAIELNHFIEVQKKNVTLKAIPLVMSKISKEKINGKVSLGEIYEVKLAVIEDRPNYHFVLDGKGKVFLVDPDNTNYAEKTRANTGYNFHPEEIMAENFEMLVKNETGDYQEALEELKTVLMEK